MDRIMNSAEGYPLSREWLNFFENQSVQGINGLAAAIGDNVIITGVEDNGGAVSAGLIIWNGEILPFQAGALGSTVVIVETVVSAGYDTNEDDNFSTILPVWATRVAKFGNPGDADVVATFNFDVLNRLIRLSDVPANSIKFLKDGEIITSFANSGNQSIATGDFTLAQLDAASTPLNIVVDVSFETLTNDNYLIINELIPSDPIFNLAKFSFYDKTVNGFKMSIQTELPLSTANVSITAKLRLLGI